MISDFDFAAVSTYTCALLPNTIFAEEVGMSFQLIMAIVGVVSVAAIYFVFVRPRTENNEKK